MRRRVFAAATGVCSSCAVRAVALVDEMCEAVADGVREVSPECAAEGDTTECDADGARESDREGAVEGESDAVRDGVDARLARKADVRKGWGTSAYVGSLENEVGAKFCVLGFARR